MEVDAESDCNRILIGSVCFAITLRPPPMGEGTHKKSKLTPLPLGEGLG